MKLTEKEVTKQIKTILKTLRIFHWKQYTGGVFAGTPGVSDILGIYKGRMLAIEVKGKGGRVSEDQQKFIDRVNAEGGIGVIAYDWWEVVVALGLEGRFKTVDKAV